MSELWPHDFRSIAEVAFGGSLNNTTYSVVNRRVEHAFKVWGGRYAMNPEQTRYAWELLAWAVRASAIDVAVRIREGGVKHPVMYLRRVVAVAMEDVVHDSTAHEGFKRRSGLVDVAAQLEEAFA
jgi:hypothetical protein